MNLKTLVDRLIIIKMNNILNMNTIFTLRLLNELAYTFNCTFFSSIRLTAKSLRRITMCGFLVGANEAEKRTLKRVQLRLSGL